MTKHKNEHNVNKKTKQSLNFWHNKNETNGRLRKQVAWKASLIIG